MKYVFRIWRKFSLFHTCFLEDLLSLTIKAGAESADLCEQNKLSSGLSACVCVCVWYGRNVLKVHIIADHCSVSAQCFFFFCSTSVLSAHLHTRIILHHSRRARLKMSSSAVVKVRVVTRTRSSLQLVVSQWFKCQWTWKLNFCTSLLYVIFFQLVSVNDSVRTSTDVQQQL